MVTCPVCEHTQAQGGECENCGKLLGAARVVEVPVARMAELEMTAVAARNIPVQVAPLEELELTRQRAGPDLPAQNLAELERTASASVGPVAVEKVPEMDLGRVEDDGVRTALPAGQVVCRYCRSVQVEGLLCERCGMRLPRVRPAPAAVVPAGEEQETRCLECGSRAHVGQLCGNCGVLVLGSAS